MPLTGCPERKSLSDNDLHPLIQTARPVLEATVHKVTGIKVLSMHHDISTVSGEKVVLFTLAGPPDFREAKKK